MEGDIPYNLIGLGALICISAVGGWLATRRMKRKLQQVLGREVKDEEVTSISAWMKADETTLEAIISDNSRETSIANAMEDAFPNAIQDRDQ